MKKLKITFILISLIILITSCATDFVTFQNDQNDSLRSEQLYQLESAENINGLFPERVYIKSKTQSFNSFYEFQIYQGKIYYKDINGKKPELWTILKGNGLPSNVLERGFRNPDRIIEINADSNELYALSDEGFFYHIRFVDGFFNSGWRWEQNIGWPDKTTLILDSALKGKRSWALSRRGDEVLWYEDINGNQHHYGTIGIVTNYILMEDGQEIKFADPGLPSDFSHNILGPERGRFIAESMSASASTVFLINSAGEMYTRLVDFDTIGSDPMFFKYTYDRTYQDTRSGSDYDTNFNPWALPAEDWKKQPVICLTGDAALTDRITIVQNGHGNDSRELRVAGLNAFGETGYFYKQIEDPDWLFRETPMELEDYLAKKPSGKDILGLRGESPDRSYPGRLWSGDEEIDELSLRLEGVNLFEGPCRLKISYEKETIDVDFYPVEMWYYLKRGEPGRDGTPKLFMVTLDIPEDKLGMLSEPFQGLIKQYLMPLDLATFGFTAEAAEGYMIVESDGGEDDGLRMVFIDNEDNANVNIELLRRIYLLQNDNTAVAFFTDNLSVNEDSLDECSRGRIIELIQKNLNYQEQVSWEIERLKGQDFSSRLSNYTYTGIESFLNMTGLSRIDYPKIYTMTMHSGKILEKIMDSAETTRRSKLWLYNYIIDHLEYRIDYYQQYIKKEGRSGLFFESPLDYLTAAGIDIDVINSNLRAADSFTLIDTSLIKDLPIILIVDQAEAAAYLIEFIDFEKSISNFLYQDRVQNGILKIQAELTGVRVDDANLQDEITFIYDGQSIILESEDGKVFYSLSLLTPDQLGSVP